MRRSPCHAPAISTSHKIRPLQSQWPHMPTPAPRVIHNLQPTYPELDLHLLSPVLIESLLVELLELLRLLERRLPPLLLRLHHAPQPTALLVLCTNRSTTRMNNCPPVPMGVQALVVSLQMTDLSGLVLGDGGRIAPLLRIQRLARHPQLLLTANQLVRQRVDCDAYRKASSAMLNCLHMHRRHVLPCL